MKVLEVRNVNDAYREGVNLLMNLGELENSRNGLAVVLPEPLCTVYTHPRERVLFDANRDANPFFHLIESIWMLAGREDVDPVAKLVKNMTNFSDDGITFHGAYGRRWRHAFGIDQIKLVINSLKKNPRCRRQVIQIYSTSLDAGVDSKDIPCNLCCHFQLRVGGGLEMTVFNRSNDAIWGAYGANAVHLTMLQEFIANQLNVPVGIYRQISDNFHAYADIIKKLKDPEPRQIYYSSETPKQNALCTRTCLIANFDATLEECENFMENGDVGSSEFLRDVALPLITAYRLHKNGDTVGGLELLSKCNTQLDWVIAATNWLNRRKK